MPHYTPESACIAALRDRLGDALRCDALQLSPPQLRRSGSNSRRRSSLNSEADEVEYPRVPQEYEPYACATAECLLTQWNRRQACGAIVQLRYPRAPHALSGCIACAQWLRVSDSPAQPRNRCHVSSCAPQSPRVCDGPHAETCAMLLVVSVYCTSHAACAARRCRTRQTRSHHCPSSVLTGHASSVRLSRRRGLAPISELPAARSRPVSCCRPRELALAPPP